MKKLCTITAVVGASLALAATAQATLISSWSMDEAASPYANSGPNGGSLVQDVGTDTAGTGAGFNGNAAHLQYSGGTSTRISSQSDPQSGNSFGFSFFINPEYVNEGDYFMTSEATGGSISTRGFDYWNWTVRAVGGAGALKLEFIVRGSGGVGAEGFAAVSSDEVMAVGGGQSGHWLHVAGGYDASSGALSLFVRDMVDDLSAVEYSGSGDSGLTTHGAGLSLGTVDYNGSYVNFAANTWVDDVKLFDAPLNATDVANLELVPEPTSALMLGVGGLAFLFGARRKLRA